MEDDFNIQIRDRLEYMWIYEVCNLSFDVVLPIALSCLLVSFPVLYSTYYMKLI
jgi:hypothetical protein